MIEIVDTSDPRAMRNLRTIQDHYDLMINKRKAQEGTRNFHPDYIQHNPLMADGRVALAEFFNKITHDRDKSRIVVHRMIAAGDYVWAHANFLNFFSDDPADTGIAGVDIFKMNADGKAIEHWDTLQWAGNPKDAAPMIGPNIARANANGMFEDKTP
jgi:predicted SnoaL-like aldol condensation-catalyzing enzyme